MLSRACGELAGPLRTDSECSTDGNPRVPGTAHRGGFAAARHGGTVQSLVVGIARHASSRAYFPREAQGGCVSPGKGARSGIEGESTMWIARLDTLLGEFVCVAVTRSQAREQVWAGWMRYIRLYHDETDVPPEIRTKREIKSCFLMQGEAWRIPT
jgi:hypothetical protein